MGNQIADYLARKWPAQRPYANFGCSVAGVKRSKANWAAKWPTKNGLRRIGQENERFKIGLPGEELVVWRDGQ